MLELIEVFRLALPRTYPVRECGILVNGILVNLEILDGGWFFLPIITIHQLKILIEVGDYSDIFRQTIDSVPLIGMLDVSLQWLFAE